MMRFFETKLMTGGTEEPTALINPAHIICAEESFSPGTRLLMSGGKVIHITAELEELMLWLRHNGNPMPVREEDDDD